mmetsp:Transcript_41933/g.94735  ORF Transcript_41933/g.94735 Transcript_41933/m.94735 type:complete len:94 (-) Transcript_41933:843-1124(-)
MADILAGSPRPMTLETGCAARTAAVASQLRNAHVLIRAQVMNVDKGLAEYALVLGSMPWSGIDADVGGASGARCNQSWLEFMPSRQDVVKAGG